MVQSVSARARGRPTAHPIDRLRIRIWFHVVKLRSSLPSAYAIELALDKDRVRKRNADVARPRKWDGYERGEVVPADRPGTRNAIEQAEARFPGTACWFRSPLWAILRGESLDKQRLTDMLRNLDSAITAVLFEAEPRRDDEQPRPQDFCHESVTQLEQIGTFDALVAAVLLAALSEQIAAPHLRELSLDLYIRLQAVVRHLPELGPFYADLFSAIDVVCKHWVYVSPTERIILAGCRCATAARR
ncbi:MAG TPA: hypothetical protein VJU59_39370 [Paraburkholderia sp.]|uniref:hypothetical protein n=1 Tax=Paraburkholderia sp. TaxID=1926495 RepID=UPI002B4A8670|nr:hypothetical protein [Paraburkholderia sp.]HKR45660.1 hypothetical protein [Paraburkholderia sp.]